MTDRYDGIRHLAQPCSAATKTRVLPQPKQEAALLRNSRYLQNEWHKPIWQNLLQGLHPRAHLGFGREDGVGKSRWHKLRRFAGGRSISSDRAVGRDSVADLCAREHFVLAEAEHTEVLVQAERLVEVGERYVCLDEGGGVLALQPLGVVAGRRGESLVEVHPLQ